MRVISFYNDYKEVGKTSLSILFASWLAYELGESVRVIDYDYPALPIVSKRKDELRSIRLFKNVGKVDSRRLYKVSEGISFVDISSFAKKKGYLILDFPSNFNSLDVSINLIMTRQMDLVVYPITLNPRSSGRALYLNHLVNNPSWIAANSFSKQKSLLLWNRLPQSDKTEKKVSAVNVYLQKIGMPVCENRAYEVNSTEAKDGLFDVLASTIDYPKGFVEENAPWLEPLFREIKDNLDGVNIK